MDFDPVVLFFIIGIVAGLARSDLRIPPAIYDFLSIYLLFTIGLKGGVELAKFPLGDILGEMVAVTLMGFILPLLSFPILRYMGRFERVDAASIAAHYGSVSVGTYAVAIAFLANIGMEYESYMVLFLVLLEMPAIIVGVILARGVSRNTQWRKLLHEVFSGKAMVCLLGGLAIGWISGPEKLASIYDVFTFLFPGALAIFLLEMGLLCSGQIGSLRERGLFIVVYGILTPLISGVIGCTLGWALGFSLGGAALLAVLAASASYIAVPAAMRVSVPEANPTLSLAASLGVTFPFNVVFGIAIYVKMAEWLYS